MSSIFESHETVLNGAGCTVLFEKTVLVKQFLKFQGRGKTTKKGPKMPTLGDP